MSPPTRTACRSSPCSAISQAASRRLTRAEPSSAVTALASARLLAGAKTARLRKTFAAVVAALAVEMIYHGLTGKV